jgi:hypothetical protein
MYVSSLVLEFSLYSQDSHEIPRIPKGFPRDSRDSQDSHGIPRTPMGFGIPKIRRFPLGHGNIIVTLRPSYINKKNREKTIKING